MRKALRFFGWTAAGLVSLLILALLVIYAVSEYMLREPHAAQVNTFNASGGNVQEGKRLASILGCTGCHEADLQGSEMVSEPFLATVHASNLTRKLPRYTDAQLAAAIREGIRNDGTTLVGMPSSGFVALSDQDTAALIKYLRTFPPAGPERPSPHIGPVGRFGLLAGQYKPEAALVSEARSVEPYWIKGHEHGRYIARIACSECHGFDLTGGRSAPDLTLASAYGPEEFTRLMRTGVGAGGRDLGLMSRVAKGRFSKLTDSEIAQLHAYLIARAERVPPQ